VTYVVAAGNATGNACFYSPARIAGAITVAASTSSDARAYFSNYGSCVDIFAPGVDIPSSWNTEDTAANTLSGTSMASPHVAGVAALYLSQHGTVAPATVAAAIAATATTDRIYEPEGWMNLLGNEHGYSGARRLRWRPAGRHYRVSSTGDHDGDRRTDRTFYRPASGTWNIRLSSTNYVTLFTYPLGSPMLSDIPVPADFDGDGRTDLAIYSPVGASLDSPAGQWTIWLSSTNYSSTRVFQWGAAADIPVPGDYDGDGKMDLAVYRPPDGLWYVLKSSANYTTYDVHRWGTTGDPVPADVDGDGRIDPTVYRPSSELWYVLSSSSNYMTWRALNWGIETDVPVLQRP
jgi:hypothetical protein